VVPMDHYLTLPIHMQGEEAVGITTTTPLQQTVSGA
jgi:hypothetical protein